MNYIYTALRGHALSTDNTFKAHKFPLFFWLSFAVKPFPARGSRNHTLLSGQPLVLTCPIQATPPPTISWFHHDPVHHLESPITDYTKFQLRPNGSLYVRGLDVSDFNEECVTVLLCHATNPAGESSYYHTLTLDRTVCLPGTDPPSVVVPDVRPSVPDVPTAGVKDDHQEDEGEGRAIGTVLSVAFSVVLVVLFVAMVTVFTYFLKLYYNR